MDGVAISIIGRPRPLPGHDTPNPAHNTYTLKCEEPVNVQPTTKIDHPTTRAASTAITGLYVEHQTTLTPSDRNQMETLQVNEQITTIKRHRAAEGRVRHRPRS